MQMILAIFFVSLFLVVLFTPVTAYLGRRFGLVDKPSGRKVHTEPVPRIGGIAIFLAFHGSILLALALPSYRADQVHSGHIAVTLFCATFLVFLVGLVDDLFGVHYAIKFSAQAIAAVVVYWGGINIQQVTMPWTGPLNLGWLSLPATILWFLLVTNSFNLIDGLDGLAAGVSFFSSIVLLLLSLISGNLVVAPALAALAGASLGFLRYNFNPASIFMGDSGSYFIGFMLAALGLLGSMKSQETAAILIPVIALGLPLMDTMLAPIRRLIVAKEPFRPDNGHVHHMLLRLGLSPRKSVLLLYGATVFLGIMALLLVNAQNREAAFILLVIGVGAVFAFRSLGYLENFGFDRIKGYLRDVTDEIGLNKGRRAFLGCQISISDSQNPDDLWEHVTGAMEQLGIDSAVMVFNGVSFNVPKDRQYRWCRREIGHDCGYALLSLNLPLSDKRTNYGMLHLNKDSLNHPIDRYTLKRIEHLRRSIVRKLKILERDAAKIDATSAGRVSEQSKKASGD